MAFIFNTFGLNYFVQNTEVAHLWARGITTRKVSIKCCIYCGCDSVCFSIYSVASVFLFKSGCSIRTLTRNRLYIFYLHYLVLHSNILFLLLTLTKQSECWALIWIITNSHYHVYRTWIPFLDTNNITYASAMAFCYQTSSTHNPSEV